MLAYLDLKILLSTIKIFRIQLSEIGKMIKKMYSLIKRRRMSRTKRL